MTVRLRPAREADAKHVALLMTELGYPSTEADVNDRLARVAAKPDQLLSRRRI